jgi:hypothetical protein
MLQLLEVMVGGGATAVASGRMNSVVSGQAVTVDDLSHQ